MSHSMMGAAMFAHCLMIKDTINRREGGWCAIKSTIAIGLLQWPKSHLGGPQCTGHRCCGSAPRYHWKWRKFWERACRCLNGLKRRSDLRREPTKLVSVRTSDITWHRHWTPTSAEQIKLCRQNYVECKPKRTFWDFSQTCKSRKGEASNLQFFFVNGWRTL